MHGVDYPEYNMGDHDWLITRTELPSCDELLQGTEPVQPITYAPTPPRRPLRRYSQELDNITGSAFTEWERRIICAQVKQNRPLDLDSFIERLDHVHARNTVHYIQEVRERAAEIKAKEHEEHVSAYELGRMKREEVFSRHRNLRNILLHEVRLERAKKWYSIVVSHVFFTVLIKERRSYVAMEKIRRMLAPIVRRRTAVRKKRALADALTRRNLENIPFPTPAIIGSMRGTFFTGWPDRLLEHLAGKARPLYLKQGSYLMHEGDLDRCMYMITLGSISVNINDRQKGKRRTKECSKACFNLPPPCYVGEFALVCKEPRSASIICETDVGAWSVSPEDYEEVAQLLSKEVKSKQREATDVRRRENLKKFFPLRVELLRQFPFFVKFSTEALKKLIDLVEPIVLHHNDVLFSKHDMDSSAYFIQDGVAVLLGDGGEHRFVPRGSCLGIFECACGVNERKKNTVCSRNYCDVWRMSREALLDVGMSEPGAFLHCRAVAKEHRARDVGKPLSTPDTLRNDPFIQFCLTRQLINRMWELSVPTIFLNNEKIVIQGQKFQRFIILHNGTVEIGDVKISVSSDETMLTRTNEATIDSVSRRSLTEVFVSRILGAYEFASLKTHCTSTVTSYGLTEAFVVSVADFEAVVPAELRAIMRSSKKGQELIKLCYSESCAAVLANAANQSFAALYRKSKDFASAKRK
uniref:Uncharacterized protein TCIL3000_11_16130 n=1 Tax=Trypanosoma congolense (strain IL3000) TaxID=1068625 RepID=G0V380_TRYCI|nr:unnamed protein product [Trypanosoma congolense IL3000]